MGGPPHVEDMDMHSLLDTLDQGCSRSRITTVPGVSDTIKAEQCSKGATPCARASLPGGRLVTG
jgi:hypothetical protein